MAHILIDKHRRIPEIKSRVDWLPVEVAQQGKPVRQFAGDTEV
ncbi:hypothetical protein [Nitrosomonas aestuarii]|nr:hypothetical protein [Nitrosomonas aestuarii]